jgi:hypothetical protein
MCQGATTTTWALTGVFLGVQICDIPNLATLPPKKRKRGQMFNLVNLVQFNFIFFPKKTQKNLQKLLKKKIRSCLDNAGFPWRLR